LLEGLEEELLADVGTLGVFAVAFTVESRNYYDRRINSVRKEDPRGHRQHSSLDVSRTGVPPFAVPTFYDQPSWLRTG
jgi:hypothetical protein